MYIYTHALRASHHSIAVIRLALNESSGLITLSHLVSILSDRIIEWGTVMKRHGRQHEGQHEVFAWTDMPRFLCRYRLQGNGDADNTSIMRSWTWLHVTRDLTKCTARTKRHELSREAVSCCFHHCTRSKPLQPYEDNPLSVCVCQDTNLPWFLSAGFARPSVTDSKMHIDQLPCRKRQPLCKEMCEIKRDEAQQNTNCAPILPGLMCFCN